MKAVILWLKIIKIRFPSLEDIHRYLDNKNLEVCYISKHL